MIFFDANVSYYKIVIIPFRFTIVSENMRLIQLLFCFVLVSPFRSETPDIIQLPFEFYAKDGSLKTGKIMVPPKHIEMFNSLMKAIFGVKPKTGPERDCKKCHPLTKQEYVYTLF